MSHAIHLVHGLANDRIPADWPPLRMDDLVPVLARYPVLGDAAGIAWHSPRPLSSAALVEAGHARVFVKRHALHVRDAQTLAEEHRFMRHLREHGFEVPEVLRNDAGKTATTHGHWVYELHACMPGNDLYRDTVSWSPLEDIGHARSAGAALARLHATARGYRAPQRSTHLLVARDDLLRAPDPMAALHAQLAERPGLAQALARRPWQEDFHKVIVPLQQVAQTRIASRPRLWTHNDWHASNLSWTGTGRAATVRAAFDFGLASPTFALFDLATAIERNAINWLDLEQGPVTARMDVAMALVEGYAQQAGPLDAAARALLADLLPVVHIDFALSEIEYFHAITRSPRNTEMAYRVFLLGHALWFARPDGQRLLHTIRAPDGYRSALNGRQSVVQWKPS